MESLNTLQRILNSIARSLASGGPELLCRDHGLPVVLCPARPRDLCYGLLYNGRVL